jgi:hypothetical protein
MGPRRSIREDCQVGRVSHRPMHRPTGAVPRSPATDRWAYGLASPYPPPSASGRTGWKTRGFTGRDRHCSGRTACAWKRWRPRCPEDCSRCGGPRSWSYSCKSVSCPACGAQTPADPDDVWPIPADRHRLPQPWPVRWARRRRSCCPRRRRRSPCRSCASRRSACSAPCWRRGPRSVPAAEPVPGPARRGSEQTAVSEEMPRSGHGAARRGTPPAARWALTGCATAAACLGRAAPTTTPTRSRPPARTAAGRQQRGIDRPLDTGRAALLDALRERVIDSRGGRT